MYDPIVTRRRFHSRLAAFAAATLWIIFLGRVIVNAAQANPFDQVVQPLEVGQAMPQVTLVDERRRAFALASLRGNAVVIGFIYTRCTDACPIITQKFAQLNRLLGPGAYRLLEVTIDPAHDTPAVLDRYAVSHGVTGGSWNVVTGNPQAVDNFVRAAGEGVIDGGHGDLIHNARLLLVSPDGRLNAVVEQVAWDPRTIAAQTRSLAGESSSPLARLDFQLTKAVAQLCGGSYQAASGLLDVVAALLIVGVAVFIMLWVRRRVFQQGA